MDIVTVVFREELEVLKLQAQSIELYCQQLDIGEITVVVNDRDLDIVEIDFDWWGTLKDHVKVVQRSAFNINYIDNGWVTQQALKLIASTMGKSSHSMILDAKTLFVKPVSLSDVFNQQGLLTLGQLDIYPVFEPSQQITEKLFDIVVDKQLGPGGVPFVVDNNQVRYMIQWIEATTGQNFLTWFQDQGMLTEFILYSGWIIRVNGSLDSIATKQNTFGTICNVCHSEVGMFDSKFQTMKTATTVSIHRRAWTQLSVQQKQQYQDFLTSKNITQAKEYI